MMPKKLSTLIVITLVLGILALLIQGRGRFAPSGKSFYPRLKIENVAAIEVESLLKGIRLEKDKTGNWSVTNKKTDLQEKIEKQDARNQKTPPPPPTEAAQEISPADSEKVKDLLATLAELEKTSPVSTNPEKQGLYQLTQVSLHVSLFDQKQTKLARLFVGKPGPDYLSTYVKDENSNEIYLVPYMFQTLLTPDAEAWKMKETPLPNPPAENSSAHDKK